MLLLYDRQAHKKYEKHLIPFSTSGSVPGTSLGFWAQSFVPSSEIGSIRSVWPRLRTSDDKFHFHAQDDNSRLREVSAFLSLNSESAHDLRSKRCLVDLSG